MISIILATRNRINKLTKMWTSALDTAHNKYGLELIMYVDDDDNNTLNNLFTLPQLYDNQIKCVTGKRYSVPLSETINICYQHVNPVNEIMFLAADDIEFKTKNWDWIIEEEFQKYPDRLLICGGNDGLNHELLTHIFIHKNWAKVVGKLAPSIYRDMYCDTHFDDVSKMIGRNVRLNDILIEHQHYTKIGEMDKTSQERMNNVNTFDESGHLFYSQKTERILEAQKLIGAMID